MTQTIVLGVGKGLSHETGNRRLRVLLLLSKIPGPTALVLCPVHCII